MRSMRGPFQRLDLQDPPLAEFNPIFAGDSI
jgi:hypothetical protein